MGNSARSKIAWMDVPPLRYDLIPEVSHTSLRYVEEIALVTTAATYQYGAFKAHGLNDPRVAVGGHQPYEFDQWGLSYNGYVVLRSRITLKVTPYSANTSPGYVWVWRKGSHDIGFAGNDVNQNFEQDAQGIQSAIIMAPGGEDRPVVLQCNYDVLLDSGEVSYMSMIGSAYGGIAAVGLATDPATVVEYQIATYGASGTIFGCYMIVSIDYDVLFYGRQPPASS